MKKRIRGLAIAILVGLMCLIAPINPCLAIDNPDSLTIYTAKVFQNIFETGDILFVVSYNIGYAPELQKIVMMPFYSAYMIQTARHY
jgi:hypothetical protein